MKKKKDQVVVIQPKTRIDQLIEDYIADPNCYPELWIAGEDLTHEEKKLFISEIKNRRIPIRN